MDYLLNISSHNLDNPNKVKEKGTCLNSVDRLSTKPHQYSDANWLIDWFRSHLTCRWSMYMVCISADDL